MTNTELRNELLTQHDELRELVAVVRTAAEQALAGRAAVADLRAMLANLAAEVLSHNAFEERELHAVLPDIDAWGLLRDGRVTLHHTAEHQAISGGLEAARRQPAAAALAEQTLRITDELLDHLEREERELLASDVLRDDIITSGVGG